MVVNPATRFELDELLELVAEEPWTVLHGPADVTAAITSGKLTVASPATRIAAWKKWVIVELCAPA